MLGIKGLIGGLYWINRDRERFKAVGTVMMEEKREPGKREL